MKLLPLLLFSPLALMALSNLEVAKQADAALSGFESSNATLIMTLKNSDGQQNVRELGIKTLESPQGDRSIITFFKPSDIKGTKLLTRSNREGDDQQWLYLPTLKQVKRISGSNKSGSFMGSEFSYEDLSSFDYEKYRYSGDAEPVVLEGKKCFKGARIPNDAATGYSKEVVWIESATFLIQKIDYYDRKQSLFKTAYFEGYKRLGGIWRVGSIRMLNHQNGKETVLLWTQDEVKQGLRESEFQESVLKR